MTPLTICLIICVLTMISYVWGKIPMGLTALLSMAAFIITGCLDPKTALGRSEEHTSELQSQR